VIRRAFYKALETLLEARARRPDPPEHTRDQTKPIPISDAPAEAPPEDCRPPEPHARPAAVAAQGPASRLARALRARLRVRAAAGATFARPQSAFSPIRSSVCPKGKLRPAPSQ
jgi:hypothetical protein